MKGTSYVGFIIIGSTTRPYEVGFSQSERIHSGSVCRDGGLCGNESGSFEKRKHLVCPAQPGGPAPRPVARSDSGVAGGDV